MMIRKLCKMMFGAVVCLSVMPSQSQAVDQPFLTEFFGEPLPIRLQQNGTTPGPAIIDSPAEYNLPVTQGGALVPLPANPIFNPGNSAMRIVDNVGSQNNSVAFNAANDGSWDALIIDFDFLILNDDSSGNGTGADGIGFGYLNTANFGADISSPTPVFSEEVNLSGSLGVGFDTFRNGSDPTGPNGETESSRSSVSVHFDGTLIADLDVTGAAIGSIEEGNAMHATIIVTKIDDSSSSVNVVVENLTDGSVALVANDVTVPGLQPYAGRMAFNGRTGGANQTAMIDNVQETIVNPGGGSTITLFEGFEPVPPPQLVGGTPYTISNLSGDAPSLEPRDGTIDVGVEDGFLRLTRESAGQAATIAFDQTSTETDSIVASFGFRGLSGEASRADGASFILFSADPHGATGALPVFNPGATAEEPNLDGALGIGFDTFNNGDVNDNDPDTPAGPNQGNHISIHWDGQFIAATQFALSDIDLVTTDPDVFHNVQVVLDGEHLVVVITDGTDSSIHIAFDGTIPGINFPGGARAGFAARTGSAFDNYDIDSVNITFARNVIPEPTTAVAMLLATGALAIGRRRMA